MTSNMNETILAGEAVVHIQLSELHPFLNHPFKSLFSICPHTSCLHIFRHIAPKFLDRLGPSLPLRVNDRPGNVALRHCPPAKF